MQPACKKIKAVINPFQVMDVLPHLKGTCFQNPTAPKAEETIDR